MGIFPLCLCLSLDSGPPQSREASTYVHLQRPSFQIRPRSEERDTVQPSMCGRASTDERSRERGRPAPEVWPGPVSPLRASQPHSLSADGGVELLALSAVPAGGQGATATLENGYIVHRPHDPTILIPGVYSKEMTTHVHVKIWPKMSLTSELGTPPKCPPRGEWINHGTH